MVEGLWCVGNACWQSCGTGGRIFFSPSPPPIPIFQEVIQDLLIKQRFDLNADTLPPAPAYLPIVYDANGKPKGPTIKTAAPVFDFFGVPDTEERTMQLAAQLVSQWSSHRESFKLPAAGTTCSPAAVMQYWEEARRLLPQLARVATTRRLRPNGNAAPERVMSLLTDMDKPTRRSTKKKTLYNVLFLRANSGIVRLLMKLLAAEI